jgi:hypothetical protein
VKTLITYLFRFLPGGLRWRINRKLNPNETFLFKLLYNVNHFEERWPQLVPQVAYFDADMHVLGVAPADWEPATSEIHPPAATEYTTFYVDWPNGQTILIADRDGKVSRLMTNDVDKTLTMEIGIHDGEYIDSLGHFVGVARGSTEE